MGRYNDASFDLVVVATSSVTRWASGSGDNGYSGCSGSMGKVGIRAGSVTNLRFEFQDSTTHAAVTLPNFVFSVFDLDGNGNERVVMNGFTTATLNTPLTNVVRFGTDTFESCKRNPSNTAVACQSPAESCPGSNCPTNGANPTNPTSLTQEQMTRAITFNFAAPTSSFTATWGKLAT